MVVKRKHQCCRIRDHSPLGLLGIFLITAGVIIAIFDAKDTLPHNSESYVIGVGVVLSILGIASIVLAFIGYRRARAMARENVTTSNGNRGRRNLRRDVNRHVMTKEKRTHPFNISGETNEKSNGPSLIAMPGCYKVVLPPDSEQYVNKIAGIDNHAFQQTPAKEKNPAFWNGDIESDSFTKDNCRTSSPPSDRQNIQSKGKDATNIKRVTVQNHGSHGNVTYSPVLQKCTTIELPEYIPPVSTIV